VNKSQYIVWGVLLLSWSALQADSAMEMDADQVPYGSETLPRTEDAKNPLKISANANFVGKAKFEKHDEKGQSLQYSDEEVDARFIYYYNPRHQEGAYVTVGYNNTRLRWKENPYFDKHDFHTASLTLGAFTHRICNWLWLGSININLDTDHPNLSEYANYDAMFWGRYTYHSDIGFNVGLLIQTGMKIDHLYPIIGIDWQISDKWTLNLVYPVNISLQYAICDYWSVSVAGRAFESRNRAGSHEPLPKALITYRNTGVEVDLDFDYKEWISANLHGGYSFGGTLKIANRHYEHKHRLPFKSAGYIGGEVGMKF